MLINYVQTFLDLWCNTPDQSTVCASGIVICPFLYLQPLAQRSLGNFGEHTRTRCKGVVAVTRVSLVVINIQVHKAQGHQGYVGRMKNECMALASGDVEGSYRPWGSQCLRPWPAGFGLCTFSHFNNVYITHMGKYVLRIRLSSVFQLSFFHGVREHWIVFLCFLSVLHVK